MRNLKVLLADDEYTIREGFKRLFDWEQHGCSLVGEAADGREALDKIGALRPDIVIMDSIQTVYDPSLNTAPGSVGQVKQCAMEIMQLAKSTGFTAFVIGHVNKEGAIAGPKVLEHMVDCVLIF